MLSRQQILREVEEMIGKYCKECFLHKHHKEEKGRRYAHRFCITQCTVGDKLKEMGRKLT
jgi:hypothetical protein